MRVIISQPPFRGPADLMKNPWESPGVWPCQWISLVDAGLPPWVAAYRKRFVMERAATVRVHVSADERYELFLDGRRIGRGPERGDANHWFFETYDLALAHGEHVVVARTWTLGPMAPYAQMTLRPGFLFAPEGTFSTILGTGTSPWEAKRLGGYEFVTPEMAWGTGHKVAIDGRAFPWGFETGAGDGWSPAVVVEAARDAELRNDAPPSHLLRPATLPPMIEEVRQVGRIRHVASVAQEVPPVRQGPDGQAVFDARTRSATLRPPVAVYAKDHLAGEVEMWSGLVRGTAVAVPPHTRRRILVDLENYYCAYPELVTSGGAGSTVRVYWSEALYLSPVGPDKGNRNEIDGKYFVGMGDTFRPDGGAGRAFSTLWWEAGRYLEIYVETADEPLVIDRFALREARYPLEMEGAIGSGDARFDRMVPIALRTLQMCSHETYMDCPYYEQLMYVGDTRLEVLTTYCTMRDDRLPRKALRMFDASRFETGLTQSRYPSRVFQVIPPFSLWWVAMVHDYSRWRDDPALVRSLAPVARGVMDAFLGYRSEDGLVEGHAGWNFMDWVPEWTAGIPPDAARGVNGAVNWQFILVLTQMAEIEESLGEPELASRARRLARDLAKRAVAAFWDEKRGLLADDLAKKHFSEHVQCLAILSGLVDAKRRNRIAEGLVGDAGLARTTIYFTHYLFEALRVLGRMDVLWQRLGLWLELDGLGFKTTFEHPEPSRSDCHAWAAHPIYHYYATILGIRPASAGFRTVTIQPQLGPQTHATGRLPHPKGFIEVDLESDGGRLAGKIRLPRGTTGTYVIGRKRRTLKPGVNRV